MQTVAAGMLLIAPPLRTLPKVAGLLVVALRMRGNAWRRPDALQP